MIGRLLFFVVCLGAPFAALSAPVSVRSGEHGDFTRLVLQITPDVIWRGVSDGDNFSIILPDHKDGFDTSAVFQRITRERVAAISGKRSELTINLNCECDVRAFREGAGLLVLDVSGQKYSKGDTLTPVPSRVDRRLSFGESITADQNSEENDAEKKKPVLKAKQLDAVPASLPPSWQRRTTPFEQSFATATSGEVAPEETGAQISLNDARNELSEQFSMASTRGLLTPEFSMRTPEGSSREPQIDTSIFDSSENTVIEEEVMNEASNIRISSSLDIDKRVAGNDLAITSGIQCIDPARLTLGEWAPSGNFQQEIGSVRSELYGEFDRANPDAVLRLARIYLHFGFGAESNATLQLDPAVMKKYPELAEMAEIFEFGNPVSGRFLASHIECNSSAALWGVLAQPSLGSQNAVNVGAALLALNELPLHIRRILAPELSRRLLVYGDKAAADLALRSLDRLPETPDMNANLARAQLDLADGQTDIAESRLEAVVDSNSKQSAIALVTLIDSEMASDRNIDKETAKLAEAYALEFRDHELGAEMRRVHIIALSKSGQHDAAFDALDAFSASAGDESSRLLLSSLVDLMTQNAPDTIFLRQAFDWIPFDSASLDSTVRFEFSRRLISLGFALEALATLREDKALFEQENGRLLRAEIALSLSQPEAAAAALFEIQGEEADTLRAMASELAGRRSEAYEAFRTLNDEASANDNAWLSDDWQSLTPQQNSVYGAFVAAANVPAPQTAISEGLLRRTESALSESATTRKAILDALNGVKQQSSSP